MAAPVAVSTPVPQRSHIRSSISADSAEVECRAGIGPGYPGGSRSTEATAAAEVGLPRPAGVG